MSVPPPTPNSNTIECYICKEQKDPNKCWANRAGGILQNYNCIRPCSSPIGSIREPMTPPPNRCTCNEIADNRYSWFNRLFGIEKVRCLDCKAKSITPPILDIGSTYELKTIRNIVEELDSTDEDAPFINKFSGLRKRSHALEFSYQTP